MTEMVTRWSTPLDRRWISSALQALLRWARLGSNQPKAETAAAYSDPESPVEQAVLAAPYDRLSDSERLSGATAVVTRWSEADDGEWPWRLRDHAVLTAEDHAEMLDLRERVIEAFGELGDACLLSTESRAREPEAMHPTEGLRP